MEGKHPKERSNRDSNSLHLLRYFQSLIFSTITYELGNNIRTACYLLTQLLCIKHEEIGIHLPVNPDVWLVNKTGFN